MAKKKKEIVQVYGKYEFNETEKKAMSMELANKSMERESVEDEKKQITSNFKAKTDKLVAEINLLSRNLTTGYDHRQIPCHKEMDFDNKVKRFTNVETGKIICEDAMTDDDLQMKFDKK